MSATRLIRSLWRLPQRPSVLLLTPLLLFADGCWLHTQSDTPKNSLAHRVGWFWPFGHRQIIQGALTGASVRVETNMYSARLDENDALVFARATAEDIDALGNTRPVMTLQIGERRDSVGPWAGAAWASTHFVIAWGTDTEQWTPDEGRSVLDAFAMHLERSARPAADYPMEPGNPLSSTTTFWPSETEHARNVRAVTADPRRQQQNLPGSTIVSTRELGPRWIGVAHTGAAALVAGVWLLSLLTTPLWFMDSWIAPLNRQRRRRRLGQCLACGYDLNDVDDSRCPECGRGRSHARPAPS
ncbi:MAG: hypothetical protein AAGK04_04260 [Planctomycetota bacterium]